MIATHLMSKMNSAFRNRNMQLLVLVIAIPSQIRHIYFTTISDSGRSKLPSKTASPSHYQNPNIYTSEESSHWALLTDHRWLSQTPLMQELLVFLIFLVQISIERKLKTAGTRPNWFWMTHGFSRRAASGTSFDMRWSHVAQTVPENELFLSKMSIFRNRYNHR